MFAKKTVEDVDVCNKTILLHAELDAPLNGDGTSVASDFRIKCAMPTIKYLKDHGSKIVIISKLGRPDGKVDPRQSLRPVAARLGELLGEAVDFAEDCIGEAARLAAAPLRPGQVLVLENLRFHPEEEANDVGFARAVAEASGAELFVQDCFALAHRKEAGTDAITKVLPSVAGLHLLAEIESITNAIQSPERPLMTVVGGAKISDKIGMLNRFLDIADVVAIGGAMANTFLAARGVGVGKSKYEADDVDLARDILARAEEKSKNGRFVFYVPQDGVVASSVDKTARTRIVDWGAHVVADVMNYPKQPDESSRTVQPGEMILDIGPFSGAFMAGLVQLSGTVIWNGTMGVTEVPALHGPAGPFSRGSDLLVDALLGEYGHKPFSVIGGGDTVGYIEQRGLTQAFNHVSAGGGASLELMSGHLLPGVEALQDK